MLAGSRELVQLNPGQAFVVVHVLTSSRLGSSVCERLGMASLAGSSDLENTHRNKLAACLITLHLECCVYKQCGYLGVV